MAGVVATVTVRGDLGDQWVVLGSGGFRPPNDSGATGTDVASSVLATARGFKDGFRRGIVRAVIRSFKDRRTRRFYEGHRVAAFQGFADQAVRRLTLLASAGSLGDLAALPSNRLESLRGDREGQFSIRINAQWRVCFLWSTDGPYDVEIVDYHR